MNSIFTTPSKASKITWKPFLRVFSLAWEEAHSEPSQKSKMELFAKIINGLKLLNILTKGSILDIWLGSEYTSGDCTLSSIF